MRARVSIDVFRSVTASLVLGVAILYQVASDPALADAKVIPVASGTEAARVVANRTTADDKAKPLGKEAVASTESKVKDPLANLKVSDQARAHQERADRALAENGETRTGDEDIDEIFSADTPAAKPQETASKPKPVSAGIQCVAGCY